MSTGLTIATICARGGSKGLPGKNIRPFRGKPLIAHGVAQALTCPAPDAVYVSTNDDAIAEAALAHAAALGLWSVNIGVYPMPRWKSVDIDDLEDFEYAQWLAPRHPEWIA